ncbi:MAG: Rieske 2Fe-2S domain-containing protein [Pseudonocardiaceae bacterium]|nr:Rieske 2Fe-2S domain-containing protein [Pseudonocardiaceae bacterium]
MVALSAAVASCASDGAPTPPADQTLPAEPTQPGGGEGGGGAALAGTDEIPVGGGTVFADQEVVVTQPTQGDFRAFSAICTHEGCTVGEVAGGTINCPCHGSKYRIADASVVAGPAPRPLPEQEITVEGDSIRLG